MRIFLLLSLLSYTTHDHYTLFSASNKQGTVEHDILLMAMTGSFKNLLNQYVYILETTILEKITSLRSATSA